jgi:hypothetical protein
VERTRGDIFSLAKHHSVPFALPRDQTTLSKLADRLPLVDRPPGGPN